MSQNVLKIVSRKCLSFFPVFSIFIRETNKKMLKKTYGPNRFKMLQKCSPGQFLIEARFLIDKLFTDGKKKHTHIIVKPVRTYYMRSESKLINEFRIWYKRFVFRGHVL